MGLVLLIRCGRVIFRRAGVSVLSLNAVVVVCVYMRFIRDVYGVRSAPRVRVFTERIDKPHRSVTKPDNG